MQWIELVKDYLGKKAGERVALDGGDANPLIAAGIARAVADDPIGSAIAKGLDGALAGFTRGLDQIIQQTLKQFADAQGDSMRAKRRIGDLLRQRDGADHDHRRAAPRSE